MHTRNFFLKIVYLSFPHSKLNVSIWFKIIILFLYFENLKVKRNNIKNANRYTFLNETGFWKYSKYFFFNFMHVFVCLTYIFVKKNYIVGFTRREFLSCVNIWMLVFVSHTCEFSFLSSICLRQCDTVLVLLGNSEKLNFIEAVKFGLEMVLVNLSKVKAIYLDILVRWGFFKEVFKPMNWWISVNFDRTRLSLFKGFLSTKLLIFAGSYIRFFQDFSIES